MTEAALRGLLTFLAQVDREVDQRRDRERRARYPDPGAT